MHKDITPSDLQKMIQAGEDLKIIDVRNPDEYARGHIANAVNIPLSTVGSSFPNVQKSDRVVVVCQAGGRSATACGKVQNSYDSLFNLAGGTGGWISQGFPVVKESSPKACRGVDRQTHFVASLLIIAAFALSHFVSPSWIYLAALPAFGLMLDATTGICPMTLILKQMPWNA